MNVLDYTKASVFWKVLNAQLFQSDVCGQINCLYTHALVYPRLYFMLINQRSKQVDLIQRFNIAKSNWFNFVIDDTVIKLLAQTQI